MAKKALYWLGYFFRSKIVFFKKKKNMYIWCVSECMYMYHVCEGTPGGQKRASAPLELELQSVVKHLIWVLGTVPEFSARAASTINKPSLQLNYKKQCKHFQSTHSVWQILGTFFHSKICLLTILLPSLSMLLASPVQYSLQDNVQAIISSSQQQIFWIDILKTKVYTYTNNPWESNTKHL